MLPDSGRSRVTALSLVLLAAVAFAVYRPALDGGFVLDDIHNIVENPAVRLTSLGRTAIGDALTLPDTVNHRRPTAFLTFSLNYLAGGYDPRGYRLVNIMILLASIPFAYLAAAGLAGAWLDRERSRLLALAATALWTLHPLLTNGVSYIVQRMTSLCTLFQLVALCCLLRHGRSRRRRWLAAALLFWTLALTTKEIALLLPLVVILYFWMKAPRGGGRTLPLGPALAVLVAASQAGLWLLFRNSPTWTVRPWSLGERLLTEGRVVLHYLSLFAAPLPTRLNLDYSFPLSTSLVSPLSTVPAWLFHAAFAGGALLLRRRRPVAAFGVLSFYLLLLLESTVLPLEIAFEHRLYFSSFFLALSLADLLLWGAERVAPRRAETAALLAALLTAAWWGSLTLERNRTWSSTLSILADTALKSPSKSRVRHNYGVVLSEAGRTSEALEELAAAAALNPGDAEIHNSTGSVLTKAGDLDGARRAFERALAIVPDYAPARNNLGNVLFLRGDREGAMNMYRAALEARPFYPEAHYNIGTLLAAGGDVDGAVRSYGRALELYPDYADAHYNLGVALARQGKFAEAADRFRETLRVDAGRLDARYNLGVALARQGKFDGARQLFREVLRADPAHAGAAAALRELSAPGGR